MTIHILAVPCLYPLHIVVVTASRQTFCRGLSSSSVDALMDVVVHHCIRELSFDGDLGKCTRTRERLVRTPSCRLLPHFRRALLNYTRIGCNVSRLKDFIVAFYNNYDGPQQVVDDAFCAFLWSIVVQQPAVRVGVVPPGTTSEVYIAPQTSAKRKAAAKGEDVVEDTPPVLQIIEDAREHTLEELKHRYGDDLRIAVDPETSFVAITGSHIRVRAIIRPCHILSQPCFL